MGNGIIRLSSIGAQAIKFLTSPPGNLIVFSLATVYFALISVESYWLAVDKMNEAFVPKPFIDDLLVPAKRRSTAVCLQTYIEAHVPTSKPPAPSAGDN